jgi:hypothetical protein
MTVTTSEVKEVVTAASLCLPFHKHAQNLTLCCLLLKWYIIIIVI